MTDIAPASTSRAGTTAARFRAAVEAWDMDALDVLFHPDVQFRSPAVHTPYQGRDACLHLLRNVAQVFSDFRYVDEVHGEHTHGLIFRTDITTPDGQVKAAEGWDYLTIDEDGLITEMAVMVRPLSGLIALAQAMGARLEADPVPKAG